MQLEGSCHCGNVKFSFESHTPQPYMRCYCSICRKTAGAGGYGINIMGLTASLQVEGMEHVEVYRARLDDPEHPGKKKLGPIRRNFCKVCASCLWNFDPEYGDFIYPFASALDSPLPVAPERVHMMVGSKAAWVPLREGETVFPEYPAESIAGWHDKRGLTVD